MNNTHYTKWLPLTSAFSFTASRLVWQRRWYLNLSLSSFRSISISTSVRSTARTSVKTKMYSDLKQSLRHTYKYECMYCMHPTRWQPNRLVLSWKLVFSRKRKWKLRILEPESYIACWRIIWLLQLFKHFYMGCTHLLDLFKTSSSVLWWYPVNN